MSTLLPLKLLLLLLGIQGYLDLFDITFFHARLITYGAYICFGILIALISVKNRRIRLYPFNFLIPIWLFLFLLWFIIGITNENYSVYQDIKGFMLIIISAIVAFISIENLNQARKICEHFSYLLLPIAFINITFNIPGVLVLDFSLGRYVYVLLFGYVFYLVKIIYFRAGGLWNYFCLIIFFLSTTVFPFNKSTIMMTLVATVTVVLLLKKVSFTNRINIKSVAVALLIISLPAFIVWKSVSENPDFYTRIIMDRVLRAWRLSSMSIDEAFLYQMSEENRWNILTSGRIDIWEASLADLNKNPLVGQGMGYYYRDYNTTQLLSVHNFFIYCLISFGIIGSFLLVLPLIKVLTLIYRGLRNKSNFDLKVLFTALLVTNVLFCLFSIILSFHGWLIITAISFGALVKVSIFDLNMSK